MAEEGVGLAERGGLADVLRFEETLVAGRVADGGEFGKSLRAFAAWMDGSSISGGIGGLALRSDFLCWYGILFERRYPRSFVYGR